MECSKNIASAGKSVWICSTYCGMALMVVALNVEMNVISENEHQVL